MTSRKANAQPVLAFPTPGHDHVACLSTTLGRARAAFEARGLRFTDLRELVFREIAASHHAIGAYDIIERLSEKGTRLAPVSVYRAIEALIGAGMVHRLESQNAYFACHADHGPADHGPARALVILSCAACGTIAEAEACGVFSAIDDAAGRHGFIISSRIVEVAGRCAHCADSALSPGSEMRL